MGPIQMPDVLMRGVSEARYDGTPGGHRAKGAARWCPGRTYRGGNRGLVITRIRTADGAERRGDEFFVWGDFVNNQT